MHSSSTATEPVGNADTGNVYSSSVDLARGADMSELRLHEVSNCHLTELVRMLQGWRMAAGTH